MLALHLLQSALVHLNTLLIQAVLEVPEFHDLIGEDERRGLTPLFWSNINFYLDNSSPVSRAGLLTPGCSTCIPRTTSVTWPGSMTTTSDKGSGRSTISLTGLTFFLQHVATSRPRREAAAGYRAGEVCGAYMRQG